MLHVSSHARRVRRMLHALVIAAGLAGLMVTQVILLAQPAAAAGQAAKLDQ